MMIGITTGAGQLRSTFPGKLFYIEFERAGTHIRPDTQVATDFVGYSTRIPAGASSAILQGRAPKDLILCIQDFYLQRL